jgi:hypothetical protein
MGYIDPYGSEQELSWQVGLILLSVAPSSVVPMP